MDESVEIESLLEAWEAGELDSPDLYLAAYKQIILSFSSGVPLDLDPRVNSLLDAGHALYLSVLRRNGEKEPRMHKLLQRMLGRGVATRSAARRGDSVQPAPPPRSPSPAPSELGSAPASPLRAGSPAGEVGSPLRTGVLVASPGVKRAREEGGDEQIAQNDVPTIEILNSTTRYLKRFKTTFQEEVILLKGLTNENAKDAMVVSLFDTILERQRELAGAQPHDRCIVQIESSENLGRPIWYHLRQTDQLNGNVMTDKLSQIVQSNENFLVSGPLKVSYVHIPTPRPGGRTEVLPGESQDNWYARMSASGIIFPVINPDNEMCLALATCIGVEYSRNEPNKFKHFKRAGSQSPALNVTARMLCASAGIDPNEPCGLQQIRLLQDSLPEFRLVVFTDQSGREIVYKGPESTHHHRRKNIYLLWLNGHFSTLLKPASAFGHVYYCDHCLVGSDHRGDHICLGSCFRCTAPYAHPDPPAGHLIPCRECNRYFSNQECFDYHKQAQIFENKKTTCAIKKFCKKCERPYMLGSQRGKKRISEHKCNHFHCQYCKKYVPEGHICTMQPWEPKPLTKGHKYIRIYWDCETSQYHKMDGRPADWLEHKVVMVVCQQVCSECESEADISKICSNCGAREHIFESISDPSCDPISDFIDFLQDLCKEKVHILLLAHNSRSFDSFYVLQECIKRKLAPELICQGQKIISMKFRNLTWKDSLMFVPLPLSKMGASFGFQELVKGFFPYLAIHPQYYNYIGPLPPKDLYCVSTMNVKAARTFHQWHDEKVSQNYVFDFQREIRAYAISDVTILRQSMEKFRSEFIGLAGFDPLHNCLSLSSACMSTYRNSIMPPHSISIQPPGGYANADRHSFEAMKWLAWEQHLLGDAAQIQHAENAREQRVMGRTVDGYFELPDGTKHILLYQGCYYHSCIKCYPTPQATVPGRAEKQRETRYEATVRLVEMYRAAGYTVKEIWGCDFKRQLKDNPEMQQFFAHHPIMTKEPLSLRQALYGGRTSTIRPYYKADLDRGERIRYVDVVSLYPSVLLNGEFSSGHPKIFKGDDINIPTIPQMNGVVKARVLPPQDLFFPLLPYRVNKKLVFPLCRSCAEQESREACSHSPAERALTGVWVTAEFQIAVQELGYTVLEVFELYQYPTKSKFDRSKDEDSLFSGYVRLFMAKKIEASGFPAHCDTPQKEQEYIDKVWEKDGIRLDASKIKKNEALRFLAKLMNNSFWGKLGEVTRRSSVQLVGTYEAYMEAINDPTKEIQSVIPIGEDLMMIRSQPTEEADQSLPTSSVIHAAQTTSFARIVLYRYLQQVQERCLYHDTDSVVYISRPGEPELPIGSFLGELTCELEGYGEGSYIYEWVSSAPKVYCAKVAIKGDPSNTAYITKLKGITINESCANLITFDNMKAMVVDNAPPVTVHIPSQITRIPGWRIISRPMSKVWRPVLTKRRRTEGHKTVPHGYALPPPAYEMDSEDEDILDLLMELEES